MDPQARYLIFHSVVVLLIGLLVGAPYGRAITRNAPSCIVNAWRLAHNALPVGATVGIAIGAVLSSLNVSALLKSLIAWSWVVSNYAFCFSLPVAAVIGQRGLTRAKPLSNQLVFTGNVVGAGASLVGTLVLLYAAYISLAGNT